MLQIGLVGLGAGAAAALLFASVTSGTWMSVPLFYIAPLPIMIAGLGWSHWSALFAAIVASAALGAFFGGMFFLAFLAGAGLPAWWLAYLALLARPGADSAAPLEWYPPGRLVVWAAVLAAVVVAAGILFIGPDAETVRAALTRSLSRMLRPEPGDGQVVLPPSTNSERLIGFLVTALPPAAAVIAAITSVFNLWLAARVVKFSGRLTRPWPVLPEMTFPKVFSAALFAAIALSFVDSIIGMVAGIASAAFLMAYGVLGFAVLHSLSRDFGGRPFVLGGVYGSVLIFGWPILVLCLLGISESVFDWRARKRRPPAPL
ncbi:MAG: DUF2232 domain-containing protein [Pseudolabrys sp.]|nr:DUF2232 domain-containing protein [Pseudolabrys sp.]